MTGDARAYRGHDDVARWFEGMAKRWEAFHAEPVELVQQADGRVLAEVVLSLKTVDTCPGCCAPLRSSSATFPGEEIPVRRHLVARTDSTVASDMRPAVR